MNVELRGQINEYASFDEAATIADVKNVVACKYNASAQDILLYCGGVPTSNELRLSDLPSLSLDVNIPLLGGKVHGSLTRAGKVKGQTPKVEKQDKKKKQTGRAKRRLQYNRRFVNVVESFGRKKGPNSNSA